MNLMNVEKGLSRWTAAGRMTSVSLIFNSSKEISERRGVIVNRETSQCCKELLKLAHAIWHALMAYVWHAFGMSLVCLWHVIGIPFACIWHVIGISMACLWH